MEDIVQIEGDFINDQTNFKDLISELKIGFSEQSILVPNRHHHDFPNPNAKDDTTLLIMPAWNPGNTSGVKVVTVNPDNGRYDLPAIQGTYILLDSNNGTVKAIIEAKSLTNKRTAATSALASSFLSNEKSNSLLMIGTGALSSNLIKAHASVRPITKVYVWGRNLQKAESICAQLGNENFAIEAIDQIESKISEVDIISAATLSHDPLIKGELLREGQHIDLVGSYKKNMREADNATIKKGVLFVDSLKSGLNESGDVHIPLSTGIISEKDIRGDLFQLCSNKIKGRTKMNEITVFKSVGHALEDLVAANYYFKKIING